MKWSLNFQRQNMRPPKYWLRKTVYQFKDPKTWLGGNAKCI